MIDCEQVVCQLPACVVPAGGCVDGARDVGGPS